MSYEAHHNEANGEGNRDGHAHNLSCNYGVEGPSEDAAIRAARSRQVRNMLATLLLAQGVPMLLGGDELSRTQAGNNNAYCQDNRTSWLDWSARRASDPDLPAFIAALAALRRDSAALRRPDYFSGEPVEGGAWRDVRWLAPHGADMGEGDWNDGALKAFGMQFGNDAPDGRRLLLLANAAGDPIDFHVPLALGGPWRAILDTRLARGVADPLSSVLNVGGTFTLPSRSLVLFRHPS